MNIKVTNVIMTPAIPFLVGELDNYSQQGSYSSTETIQYCYPFGVQRGLEYKGINRNVLCILF